MSDNTKETHNFRAWRFRFLRMSPADAVQISVANTAFKNTLFLSYPLQCCQQHSATLPFVPPTARLFYILMIVGCKKRGGSVVVASVL